MPGPPFRARVARLERAPGTSDVPTWAEVHAAEQRLTARARAQLQALIAAHAAGRAPTELSPAERAAADADADTVRRYHAARGVDVDALQRAAAPASRARLAHALARRLAAG